VSCYRKALYLDPNHGEVLIHLALLLEKVGKKAEAQLLRKATNRCRRGAVQRCIHTLTRQAESRPSVASCWSTIGVQGDRSCPELDVHVHCRNWSRLFPRGRGAARQARPGGVHDRPTRHFGAPKAVDERETQSVVIFRIGREWFALPTSVIAEVAGTPRHPLAAPPAYGIVLGVVNVRGELLVCGVARRLLGLESPTESIPGVPRTGHDRCSSSAVTACASWLPADEVSGRSRFHSSQLKDVPTTVGKAASAHSRAVLSWSGHVVACLMITCCFVRCIGP